MGLFLAIDVVDIELDVRAISGVGQDAEIDFKSLEIMNACFESANPVIFSAFMVEELSSTRLALAILLIGHAERCVYRSSNPGRDVLGIVGDPFSARHPDVAADGRIEGEGLLGLFRIRGDDGEISPCIG